MGDEDVDSLERDAFLDFMDVIDYVSSEVGVVQKVSREEVEFGKGDRSTGFCGCTKVARGEGEFVHAARGDGKIVVVGVELLVYTFSDS